MPLPIMKSGTGKVIGFYRLGAYNCMLIESPEALGPINYFFMLLVSKEEEKTPTFVVTCEHNTIQTEILKSSPVGSIENAPEAFICYFNSEGNHFIQESAKKVPEAEEFRIKAFELAKLKLDITEEAILVKLPNQEIKPSLLERINLSGKKLVQIVILVLVAFAAFIYFEQPKTLNDCILQGMKGVASDFAARSINHACHAKFPDRYISFNGLQIKFPNDATDKEISETLRKTYGATEKQISAALAHEGAIGPYDDILNGSDKAQ